MPNDTLLPDRETMRKGTPAGGVERELIRLRDRKHVGTLGVRRCTLTLTRDEAGNALSSPRQVDSLVVTIDARGEQVCWVAVPTGGGHGDGDVRGRRVGRAAVRGAGGGGGAAEGPAAGVEPLTTPGTVAILRHPSSKPVIAFLVDR
jgi:hypothetical protein